MNAAQNRNIVPVPIDSFPLFPLTSTAEEKVIKRLLSKLAEQG